MDSDSELSRAGRWWRFSDYVLEDSRLKPGEGAALEEYEPWGSWAQDKSPYDRLVDLVFDVKVERARDGAVTVVEGEEELIRWCRDFGLPGTLLQRTREVWFAPRGWLRPSSDPVVCLAARGYTLDGPRWQVLRWTKHYSRSAADKYLRRLVEHGMLSSTDPFQLPDSDLGPVALSAEAVVRTDARALLPDVSTQGVRLVDLMPPLVPSPPASSAERQDLEATWGRFFPGLSPSQRGTHQYPPPLSRRFWNMYAEPLDDFFAAAFGFVMAFTQLQLGPIEWGERFPGYPVLQVDDPGARLNGLLATVAQQLVRGEAGPRIEWRYPSLWALFAKTAVDELVSGGRIDICKNDNCRKPFIRRREWGRYCSPRCKEATKKRRRWNRKKEAAGKLLEPEARVKEGS